MANYVWNRVYCDKETLDKYFIDYNPFGTAELMEKAYITFNKLYDVKSIQEYGESVGTYISYGYGFSYRSVAGDRYEIKFCTRWEYPIAAIKKAITLAHNIEWYAVEENCIYVSKFYWNNEIKEDIMRIEEGYYKWLDSHMEFEESLADSDYGVWYYLQEVEEKWKEWKSNDDFKRYQEAVFRITPPSFDE